MAIYQFKLTDTDSGEFRIVSVAADSLEEAEQTVLRQEAKKVNLTLNEEELATLQVLEKVSQGKTLNAAEKERFVQLVEAGRGGFGGRDKARLQAHRQEKAYTIQKGKEASS